MKKRSGVANSLKNIRGFLLVMFFILPGFFLELEARTNEIFRANNGFYVSTKKSSTDFVILEKGNEASLVVSAFDHKGVVDVMELLQSDMKAVSGIEPKLLLDNVPQNKPVIIAGTVGKSPLIDQLVKMGKLNVDDIKGRWENSLIEVVDNPFPNVDKALVIAGSDKRGTIYGIFELSAQMGVSPWYWWADVPTRQQTAMYVKAGRYNLGEPKVKYRGIFLNDEEPCLGRWAVDNYGGFNRQFYTRLFELILRLKGNYLWPAMWWASFCTDDPFNDQLADEYGIVMGKSHHEPMNRAWAEWKNDGKGAWNYETNSEELKKFWTKGIERIGDKEVIVVLAMRGDGDEAMSPETNTALLEKIVEDQRKIIADVTGKPVTETPQMWALYKEVQDYYDKGMRVPDDVTLLLCDDNWGNLRKLPAPGTPAREGGYGIYYHFDYVGGPRNYKWLNTVSIPRVWEQMNLAYENGVTRVWLVNVGDLKPLEFPVSFFLDYAWNPDNWPAEKLPQYSVDWASQQFGDKQADDIAKLLDSYTRFNNRRKPELLSPMTYSLNNYREAEIVVTDYNNLVDQAQKIQRKLPNEYSDAFYELVLHPIEACANLNELYVTVAKNRQYADQWRINTNDLAKEAEKLFKKDADITDYYNTKLAGGKWNDMMDQTHIGYTSWQQPDKNIMPDVKIIQPSSTPSMGVAVEGSDKFIPRFSGDLQLPVFDPFNDQSYYIELFNQGKKSYSFQIEPEQPWIKVSETKGKVNTSERVFVSIDWKKAPEGENSAPVVITDANGTTANVQVKIMNYSKEERKNMKGYFESNGCISIEASHFTKNLAGNMASWKDIPGLGRTLSAMHPVPVTAARHTPGNGSPVLEYDIYLLKAGEFKVNAYLAPTLNYYNNDGIELAISIDDQAPKIVNMHTNFSFRDWEKSMRDNISVVTSDQKVDQPGNHTLKVWMVDPGVVLEKIIIQTGEEKSSYLGAPESYCISKK